MPSARESVPRIDEGSVTINVPGADTVGRFTADARCWAGSYRLIVTALEDVWGKLETIRRAALPGPQTCQPSH